ncbi:N-glycosidase [Cladobotryum mycophilum]|uniref:N-glycosidase n=1 Tax=Cladobotryum mycophilum TaxID=491253 RepID=A0ABR0SWU4_9HYPO
MADDTSTKPLYFWKETDGKTGYLSQWYYCPFRDDVDPEKIYDTAEHYMMHQKALLFKDEAIAAEILTVKYHPRKIKALGRAVQNFSDETWVANREAIVVRGNMLKFTNAVTEEGFRMGSSDSKKTASELPLLQGSLKDVLLSTGERELVEASPRDRIWGVGFGATNAGGNRGRWGLNLLGKALMEVRKTLREQDAENEAE